jgi:type III secretory pathway lipoprotein EscJ
VERRGISGLALVILLGIGCAQRGPALTGDGKRETGLAAFGAGLVPSATEERARYAAALGAELAGHLRHLGGVVEASVVIDLPAVDPLRPAPTVPPRPTASVVLVTSAAAPPGIAEEARRLVAGAVTGLSSEAVTVVATPAPTPPAAPALPRVGPFEVAPGSRRALQLTLAAGLLAIAALAGWVFAVEMRRRRDSRPG